MRCAWLSGAKYFFSSSFLRSNAKIFLPSLLFSLPDFFARKVSAFVFISPIRETQRALYLTLRGKVSLLLLLRVFFREIEATEVVAKWQIVSATPNPCLLTLLTSITSPPNSRWHRNETIWYLRSEEFLLYLTLEIPCWLVNNSQSKVQSSRQIFFISYFSFFPWMFKNLFLMVALLAVSADYMKIEPVTPTIIPTKKGYHCFERGKGMKSSSLCMKRRMSRKKIELNGGSLVYRSTADEKLRGSSSIRVQKLNRKTVQVFQKMKCAGQKQNMGKKTSLSPF